AGTLVVNLVNGYSPNLGDTLPAGLTYRSVTRTFAPITPPKLPSNEKLTPTYRAPHPPPTGGKAQPPSTAHARAKRTGAPLTASELAPIVSAAITRWIGAGITSEQTAALRHARIELADLHGAFLGLEGNNTIQIDRTADGYGWFLDATPMNDGEFT